MPLALSLTIILFLEISMTVRVVRSFGLVNITNFFNILFFTAVMTLVPKCFDEMYVTGVHSVWYQSLEMFQKVAHVLLLTLSSFYLGWLFASKRNRVPTESRKESNKIISGSLFYIALLIGCVFSIIFKPQLTLTTATYGEILSNSKNSLVMASNGIALFSTVVAFYALLMNPDVLKKTLFIILFGLSFIYCGFLAGARVEQLGCLVGLFVSYQFVKKKEISRKAIYVGGLMVFLILGFIGFVRNGNKSFGANDLESYLANGNIFYTQKDAMTTSLTVLGLERDGFLKIDYGKTFFDVIISIFPRALDPNRPEQFDTKISEMTQWPGGSFIINEPYISGGALVVFVTFLLLGWSFRVMETKGNSFNWNLIYLSLVCGMPRFVYYGWLPAYRFITIAVFYIFLHLILRKFDRRPEYSGYKYSNINSK